MDAFEHTIALSHRQLSPKGLLSSRLSALSRGARPDGVLIVGMGGSGLAGEVLKGAERELGVRVPVLLSKDYGLPEVRGLKRPLVIFVSFSGNTEETLSGLRPAIAKRWPIAAVAGGGALVRAAERERLPLVAFSVRGLTPRQALGTMFYAVIEILLAARLLPKRAPNFAHLDPKGSKEAGERMGRALAGKLIHIYTDEAHAHLGRIWKVALNETAKAPAFANVLPEATHNEIESFEKPRIKSAAIFLSSPSGGARLRKKTAIFRRILASRGVTVLTLPLRGTTKLERTWRSFMLAEWSAYFLAKREKRSPKTTALIEKIKQLMG